MIYIFARVKNNSLTGPVKIGISNQVESRLRSVQTACPFQIEIAFRFSCPIREIARGIELSFHKTQTGRHLYGEWFDYHPVDAIHLLCIAYRAAIIVHCEPDIHEEIFDFAGVLAAEQRFGLPIPTVGSVQ